MNIQSILKKILDGGSLTFSGWKGWCQQHARTAVFSVCDCRTVRQGLAFELSRLYFSHCQPLGKAALLENATAKEQIAQPFVFRGRTNAVFSQNTFVF